MFQSYHLLDDLTVAEGIDLPLSYKDIPKSERQALVADTLDRFNIVGKKDLFPNQLSGGQQQLVGIARAVIHKPALLLADEPTGNLHSEQAKEIMEMFRILNQQGTTDGAGDIDTLRKRMRSMARERSSCAMDGCIGTRPGFPRRCRREGNCFIVVWSGFSGVVGCDCDGAGATGAGGDCATSSRASTAAGYPTFVQSLEYVQGYAGAAA